VIRVGDAEVPNDPAPNRRSATPPGNAELEAQLAQVRGLEAKLTQERWQLRMLQATITGETSVRGGYARQ
jgi:hypothetical protein